MTAERFEFDGGHIDIEILFPGIQFQDDLRMHPFETGELLAKPENHDTLEQIIWGALDTAATDEQRLAVRNRILDGMAFAGLAEKGYSRLPRIQRFLGRAITKKGRFYTFPHTPYSEAELER